MSDPRPVLLTREDIVAIEEAAHARIRVGGVKEGFELLGRCLAWRCDSGIGGEVFDPEPPSNVYPIVTHAGDNWSRKVGA